MPGARWACSASEAWWGLDSERGEQRVVVLTRAGKA
jgi:hypothetical protein